MLFGGRSKAVIAALTHQMVRRAPRNCGFSWYLFALGASDIFHQIIHDFFFQDDHFVTCLWNSGGHFLLLFENLLSHRNTFHNSEIRIQFRNQNKIQK
jgi:hypothetical protein